MRSDALGFWWEDRPAVKQVKVKPRPVPPEPVWLRPDYLPGLAEAQAFPVQLMDDLALLEARSRKERLVFDIECYQNYFLAAFASVSTGKVAYVEMTPETKLDINKLGWILTSFTTVGFNSLQYDIPIASLALAEKSNEQLKEATNHIILEQWRPSDVLKKYRARSIAKQCDHIDLIEVTPLFGGLKVYSGRLHAPRMQDLPFHHAAVLSPEQMAIVRWYCVNDLVNTAVLGDALKEQLVLREALTREYGTDVRSKSDAQIAETVIGHELERKTRERPKKTEIAPGTSYRYHVPNFIRFHTPLMNWALQKIAMANFVVEEHGSCGMPPELKELKLQIGHNVYTMGIGGLHSTEQRVAHVASDEWKIYDRDVTSYYPQIILNLGLYPQHLGPKFLEVYKQVVDKRLKAKKEKRKLDAESLKIAVNGAFGKLGNKHSIFYSPDLLIQVTLTGQLALLMMIERLTLAGVHVVSANTDGITFKVHSSQEKMVESIIKEWEQETRFETEETKYRAYYGRDVNNYIAVGVDDKIKSKGAYANPWGHMDDSKNSIVRLHKNPVTTVVLDAVEQQLVRGTPVTETIRACKDICRFVAVRTVTGGAVKNGEYLGKTVRWYYATGDTEPLIVAKSGHKVPRSDGARPLMVLPSNFPDDVDFEWYEREANKILVEIGYADPVPT